MFKTDNAFHACLHNQKKAIENINVIEPAKKMLLFHVVRRIIKQFV
jgi:hypothetical protein